MRRQGLVWLAAAVLALGAAACFSDPTKSLRNGPTRLSLAQNTLLLHTGDSASVQGLVYDDQGNELTMTGATWTSTDATIASVRPDTANPIPGDAYTRGIIKATAAGGGITTVVLTLGSLTDTVRVTVLPALFPGATTVTGTVGADTIIAPPAATVFLSAKDTLVLDASGTTVTFDAAASQVLFGPDAGYIVSRTATVIKAMSRRGFQGAATVTNLTFAGNAQTGPILVASINTSNISIQRARFRGTIGVAASGLGANTLVTLTAPAGITFSAASKLVLGASNATVLSSSGATLSAISSAAFNGLWKVTGVTVGAATVDSLRPIDSTHVVVAASFFPGVVANGNGRLLDTVTVAANGTGTFTTAGASASTVTVNGAAAFVVRRTTDSMYVISKHGGTAKVTVTNYVLAGPLTVPSLTTSATLAVDSVTTDEANEPGNQSSATATAITGITNIGDSVFVYGAMNSVSDARDYYTFTMPAAGGKAAITLTWFGTGAGNNDANPDFDIVVCTALSSGSCSYGNDVLGNAASQATMPEVGTSTAIAGSAQVWVRTFSYYATANAGEHVYQIKIKTTP